MMTARDVSLADLTLSSTQKLNGKKKCSWYMAAFFSGGIVALNIQQIHESARIKIFCVRQ